VIHCGLCLRGIEDGTWEDHVRSEEHQRNLADPAHQLLAYGQHLVDQAPAAEPPEVHRALPRGRRYWGPSYAKSKR